MGKTQDEGGCECAEMLEFRLTQFKIIAAIAVLILLFISDPGVSGH
jgi:hypothetical protein